MYIILHVGVKTKLFQKDWYHIKLLRLGTIFLFFFLVKMLGTIFLVRKQSNYSCLPNNCTCISQKMDTLFHLFVFYYYTSSLLFLRAANPYPLLTTLLIYIPGKNGIWTFLCPQRIYIYRSVTIPPNWLRNFYIPKLLFYIIYALEHLQWCYHHWNP